MSNNDIIHLTINDVNDFELTFTIAERHYQNHLKAVRKYQQNNRDKVNADAIKEKR